MAVLERVDELVVDSAVIPKHRHHLLTAALVRLIVNLDCVASKNFVDLIANLCRKTQERGLNLVGRPSGNISMHSIALLRVCLQLGLHGPSGQGIACEVLARSARLINSVQFWNIWLLWCLVQGRFLGSLGLHRRL
jgi:hypothetical protein